MNIVPDNREVCVETDGLGLWYGSFQALIDVSARIRRGLITALIGPSG